MRFALTVLMNNVICNYGIDYGSVTIMSPLKIKKVTMELPADLIDAAQAETKESLTETVRQGLSLLAARRAGKRLAALQGKVDLKIDLAMLRRDRKS